jgi:hypothetical protein
MNKALRSIYNEPQEKRGKLLNALKIYDIYKKSVAPAQEIYNILYNTRSFTIAKLIVEDSSRWRDLKKFMKILKRFADARKDPQSLCLLKPDHCKKNIAYMYFKEYGRETFYLDKDDKSFVLTGDIA